MADNTKIDYNELFEEARREVFERNGNKFPEPQPTMNQDLFNAAIQQLDQQYGYKPPEQPQADQTPEQQAQPEDGSQGLLSQAADLVGRSASGAMDLWKSVGAGVAEAGLETKDFLFGEPSEADKSQFRKDLEARSSELSAKSPLNAVANDIAQFTTGMIGAGKLMAPIKAVQKLKTAGKAGVVAYEVGRGAAAGAVVIDPHQERLSNLIQQYPSLQNPVTEYLAAQPEDSAAEGRLKNALEGIGMDLALAGVFAASVKALKYFRAGDHKAGAAALKQVEKLDNAATASKAEAAKATPVEAVIEQVPSEAAAVPAKSAKKGYKPKIKIEEPDYAAIIKGSEDDAAAIAKFGSREEALASGYKFSSHNLPWDKLNSTEEVHTFVAITAKVLKTQFDAAKGGAVLADSRVKDMIRQTSELFGEDPMVVMGELAKAGENAKTMVADMQASFIVARKMFEDTAQLATHIKLGLLDEFGGDIAKANQRLIHMHQAAADMMASGASMRASAGRTMRWGRSEFAISKADVEAFSKIDPAKLADVLASTKGDLKKLRQTVHPGFWRRVTDEAAFLLTNNLLWNWTTHAVNTTTNLYMLAARPGEKFIGSLFAGKAGATIRRQAAKEYAYTIASLGDAWESLVDAFQRADSVLAPHQTEYFATGSKVNAPPIAWKPVKDTWDLFYNGMAAANYGQVVEASRAAATGAYRAGVGLPTRALGAMDEFVKTLRYRAVVQARAAVEGAEAGLSGKALADHVASRLEASLDSAGRALDAEALQEAKITTFQQELLEGTAGATIQNVRAAHPVTTLILPYVKTPINVLRYSVKMTPGLNLVQAEYRQMLSGALGAEAQAHAIGQMALGGTFMGLAASLVLEGKVTGGGPKDPALLSNLRANGWSPYSFVFDNEDGTKTYFPISRFDPVGMVFGMMADLVDMRSQGAGRQDSEKGSMAVLLALAKSFTDHSFLMNVNLALRAATDPENHAEKYAGQLAGNLMPFSSAMRVANPDPYLRDARSFLDNVLRNVPGYSETLPPRRDAFGEPIWSRIGLATTEDADLVEAEHNRIMLETGEGIHPPAPSRSGLDLRDVTLSNGRNAYDVFQEYAAQPPKGKSLKEALAKLIRSEGYQKLVDGEARLKGTKLGAIADVVMRYREAGFKRLLHEFPELRKELTKKQVDVKDAIRAKREAERKPGDAEKLLKSLGY